MGEPGLAAAAPNYEAPGVPPGGEPDPEAPAVSPASPDQLPELREVKDDFDRSIQPQPGVNPGVQLPPIQDSRLNNGVRMLSVANDETPTITLQVVFDMGQRDEPPGKAGLANLTAALMNEASKKRSAADFSEALERIGASVGVGSGQYQTTVSMDTLARHFDEAMALLMERLLEPAFTEEDFQRVKSQIMESLRQGLKSGPGLAGRALGTALLGPTHPLSYPSGGLPSTVGNISLDDVKAFYAAHIPSHMRGVLVSTSLPQPEIDRVVAGLGELAVTQSARESIAAMPEPAGRTIYLVDKPGAPQSSVRIAHPSLPYDALGDYYRAGLMNFTLGGTFDSRINLKLREEKGWTYGAYTGFNGGQELGSFQFSAEINQENTLEAINEVLAEVERFSRDGMTDAEYEYMQNAIGQSEALLYETPGRKLGLLGQVLIYDLPLDYRSQQKALMQQTHRETLNELAARLLQPGDAAIIVVGDAATLRPQLEQLQVPIKVLDEEGFEHAN
jgi:zinc protease